jgi:hypothetical protein
MSIMAFKFVNFGTPLIQVATNIVSKCDIYCNVRSKNRLDFTC